MANHPKSNADNAQGRSKKNRSEERGQSPTTPPPRSQGRDHVALQREADALRSRRSRSLILLIAATTIVVVVGVLFVVATRSKSSLSTTPATQTIAGPRGPEGVPLEEGSLLASASSAATGQPVDGVECNADEQVAYHVHTHVSVFVNGRLRPIPAGIGIVSPQSQQTLNGSFDEASQCYYWLHMHAQDGIIHIESPAGHTYTLGNFFDLWGQPLSNDQVGPATGALSIFVNGKRYRGNPRSIELGSHEDIQIDVGTPAIHPEVVNWSASSL
jgi:hypothetical protein